MRRVFIVVLMTVAGAALALPPVFVVGVGGGSSLHSSDESGVWTPSSTLTITGGYRSPLTAGSYMAASASLRARYLGGAISDIVDFESIRAEIGAPIGPAFATIRLGVDSSIHSIDNAGGVFAPALDLELVVEKISRSIEPLLQYRVAGTIDAANVSDALSHELFAGVDIRPGLRTRIRTGIRGAATSYPEMFVLDSTGSPTEENRRDLSVDYELDLERVLGLTTFLSAGVSVQVLDSKANRTVEGTVENDTQDAVSLDAGVELNVSPHPSASAGFGAYAVPTWFLSRTATSQDAAGDLASTVEIGAFADADYGFTEGLFVVGSVSGSRVFSNDDALETYTGGLRLGLEYRF